MAGPYDFTGQNIENTYQRVIQTPDGVTFYDGTGSLVNIGGGTGTPGLPNTSIQFNGNGFFSGSNNFTFNSASNSMTLTGSMFTTGSNTLVGNTILSGALQIQGQYPPSVGSESVSIVGNMDLNGYLRFDPVSSNINTSLSASYIYVSGSTNDLYFSQNGNGYNNVTRLRWLEGNLYTGLLNGGIITATIGTNTYQISSGSGIIVNLNASYNDNPYPVVQYVNWGNLTGTIDALSGSFDQQFVAISSSAGTAVIKAQGTPYNDGDYNNFIPIGIIIHQNRSTINASQTFPGVAYGWKQRSFDFIKAFGPLKISGYTLAQSGSSTRGLVLSGGVAWVDGRNYIVDPNNPSYITEATGITTSKIYRYYQSGSNYQNNWGYLTNAGAGYTDIDPTQYSNAGTLTPVGTNDWTIQRVFYFPNSATKAFYIYYGNATYSSKDNAIAGILTETFNEAPNTAANAIFVGYMILRYNASFNTAASYEFRAGGLFRGSGIGGAGGGGGGSTTLAGLTDVSLSSLNYGDLLMYNASTGLWNNTHTLSGSYILTGSLTTNDGLSVQTVTASFISASGGITGSLLGTASYATTASYALNGGVTQLLAGPNITLSPTNGLGQVTVSSTGGGGGNTTTGSYGSFYDTTIQTIGTVGAVYSMSLNTTDISNGVSISGSVNPYNTYIKTTNAGVYDIQFSAQLDKTTGTSGIVYIWLRKNGTDIPETNTAVTLAGGVNDKAIAAWNWFVNANAEDYFQIIWAATNNNIRLFATGSNVIDAAPAIPSLIVTANRIDQFLSNTGSFTGSFTGQLIGTASWAQSSSQALTASYYQVFPYTGSAVITGSLILTGSLTTNDGVSVQTLTASFVSASSGITGSLFGTSSWAVSASSTPNALITASVSSNVLTFTKGNGTTFNLTVNTGSGGGGGTPGGSNTYIQFNSASAFSGSGNFTYNYQSQSLQQGYSVVASGQYSHAEGIGTQAIGFYSHAEGTSTVAGQYGYTTDNVTSGIVYISSGYGDVTTAFSGYNYLYINDGNFITCYEIASVAYTSQTEVTLLDTAVTSNGDVYIVGSPTPLKADRQSTNAQHAEGQSTQTVGNHSHAEGTFTRAAGDYSHAEGSDTYALGNYSHAEGEGPKAIGYGSHAEGSYTVAIGPYSHAEGNGTQAVGDASHAEGNGTYAIGDWSHAEGNNTYAVGWFSHAEGFYTIASGSYQTVVGQYNKRDNTTDLFVVGGGSADADANRKDILNVSTTGVVISGSVRISGSLTLNNNPIIKAGSGSAASFTGTPRTSTITFTSAFTNNNYAVTVTGEDARNWSIQSKAASGFTINSSSSVALTGPVYWIATPFGS